VEFVMGSCNRDRLGCECILYVLLDEYRSPKSYAI
jgi:hypothetical protein